MFLVGLFVNGNEVLMCCTNMMVSSSRDRRGMPWGGEEGLVFFLVGAQSKRRAKIGKFVGGVK